MALTSNLTLTNQQFSIEAAKIWSKVYHRFCGNGHVFASNQADEAVEEFRTRVTIIG